MSVIWVLLPISLIMATCGLVGFIWATKSGQFEDLKGESLRMHEEWQDELKK